MQDDSIEIESVKNFLDVYVIEVDSIFEFISPVQILTDKKEVE